MSTARNPFKRGNVWYIRWNERLTDGTRKQHMEACPGMNKKEAEARLEAIKTEIARGTYINPSKESVNEYLARWMAHCETTLAPATIYEYQGTIRRYITPNLGHICVSKLQPLQIQMLIDKIVTPTEKGGMGLSRKTAYNTHGVLHRALHQAVMWGVILRNPMDSVVPPKKRMREMKTATPCELGALMGAIEDSPYRIAVMIAIATGLRRGEISGLKWIDVDYDAGVLHVLRSYCRVPKQPGFTKEPKSGKSRHMPMPDFLIEELKYQRQWQLRNKLSYGGEYAKDEGWVCTFADGRHIMPNAITKGFIRIRNKLNMSIRFHELRHTFGTELMMSGIPTKTVSDLMGHSKSGITLDLYGHALPRSKDQATEVIDVLLQRAKKQANQ